jgi:NAD(P)-dependent dehydrogenase (short-subunit alcohol dehydrogenase family)
MEGKVAVVTGAAKGIGRETSKVLAAEGARVALTDIEDQECESAAEEIRQAGGTAGAWHLDVASEDEVKARFAEIHEELGGLDVLVNNAGISGVDKPTHEIALEEWHRVITVNVTGVFLCTKHALPYMKRAGSGSIINLSSIYGLVSAQDIPPYHASKGAVNMMTKTDALLYAEDRIRVNSVHPGFIWTPLVKNFLQDKGDVEEGRKALVERHPIGRVGNPEDIAYGILYLASDESSFVTGSQLVIDGGYTAR